MNTYAVPSAIIYGTLFFILLALGAAVFFLFQWINISKKDIIIFLDKNNRFKIQYKDVSGDSLKDGKKTYYLNRDGSPINRKGKGLFIFSDNRPEPIRLEYNKKTEWADSETLMSMVNNDMAKIAFQLENKKNSILELLSMIAGLIAGAGVILLILVQFGVVNVA